MQETAGSNPESLGIGGTTGSYVEQFAAHMTQAQLNA